MKTYYSHTAALITSIVMMAFSSATPAAGIIPTANPTGTIDAVSGILTPNAPIKHSYVKVNGTYVMIAAGTTVYSANLTVGGVSRRYVVMRPDPAPAAAAPMLLLLHPVNTSPENMAALTGVTDFVLTQGFWAVMPAAIDGKWDEDPTISGEDDVDFISALIDSLSTQGVDARRVYAAGYSNGGFMTERLACDLSDKIAAFGIDAAVMRGPLTTICSPEKQRSKIYFLGTADSLIPYDGIYSGTPSGFWGALDTMGFWADSDMQRCGGTLAVTLPNRIIGDGTTVQETDYTGCAFGTSLKLYTVLNGGHAWPDGLTSFLGATTQDVDATGLIWNFVKDARR